MLELHTGKKDTYRIKEEITLPGTKENIGTILWTDIVNRKLDSKLIDDQLVVKGELLVFCLYLSEEQKEDWIEQTVPYEWNVPGQRHRCIIISMQIWRILLWTSAWMKMEK